MATPPLSSRHGISCSRHLSRSQAKIPLISAVQISRTTSVAEYGALTRERRLTDVSVTLSLIPLA
ncbi:hypothetical protein F9K91_23575 [Brucella tritici]|uniref:Uncharacterized protein n=1 Tax=Brucella tritici TaxID=94626 RepID=A0A833FMM7_9HYPH|nr:hypothetical protein F9K91_23575 [Brucella tritici]